MHQITRKVNDSDIVGVQYPNNIVYSSSDLRLFAEVACMEIGLNSLRQFIQDSVYRHYLVQEHIRKIAAGVEGYLWNAVTETSKKYHIELFDVMYIKKLGELPLMINGDPDLVPVISWRFEIAK